MICSVHCKKKLLESIFIFSHLIQCRLVIIYEIYKQLLRISKCIFGTMRGNDETEEFLKR